MTWPAALRCVGAGLALLCATMARAEEPSRDACHASRDIKVEDARLVVVPDVEEGLLRLVLSGRAVVSDLAKVQARPAATLCSATISGAFAVNENRVCNSFAGEGGGFSGHDKVTQDNDAFTFELSGSMVYAREGVRIVLPKDAGICAEQLVVETRPGQGNHFARVNHIPQFLGADRAEFLLRLGVRSEPFDVYLRIDPDSENSAPDKRSMFGPPSWNEPIEGVRPQLIVKALMLSLFIALLFTSFERKHPPPSALGSVSDWLGAPLTVAMAFYTASALMECATDVAALLLHQTEASSEPFAGSIETLADWTQGYRRVTVEAMLLTGSIPVCAALRGLGWLPCRFIPRFAGMIAFPLRAMLYGSVIAATACLLAAAVWLWGRPLRPAGFEGPALVISMFYALLAVRSLKKLFDLSWSWVACIALIVAITAFYPSDPVFSSSTSDVRIGDNTAVWARFLCHPAANFLYVAALAGFAYRVAKAALDEERVTRWLIFLLILQVASFSISDPTNALAVMGVVLIAPHWLLAPVAVPAEVQAHRPPARPRPTLDWDHPRASFAFAVGGVAAFVFLMQFIFEAGGSTAHHRFALLGLANVPRTFAIGYCAGLVLSRAGPRLRGDSATLKAANVSLLILLTNIASALVFLQGRERLIGALASSLGVIAALILSAMIVYDLQRARRYDGHLQWRDLFKGTTLAQGIPIVSAVAAALFTALSPIFIHDIGEAFGTLLKIALPQVSAGS